MNGGTQQYYFFLDETGDHGLSFVDPNFPYFSLCGCLFSQSEKDQMETVVDNLKQKFFGNTNVILHSRDIRKCEKEYQILFDQSLKKAFYADINAMMQDLNFTIIAAVIDKEKHIKKYGKTAQDPYCISLSFLLERLVFCLDKKVQNGVVKIFVESRGKREDKALLEYFNTIFDLGTYYVSPERMQARIKHFAFCHKKDNDNGIQITDLCAYPLVRGLIEKGREYPPLSYIREKIYAQGNKRYGFKIFP